MEEIGSPIVAVFEQVVQSFSCSNFLALVRSSVAGHITQWDNVVSFFILLLHAPAEDENQASQLREFISHLLSDAFVDQDLLQLEGNIKVRFATFTAQYVSCNITCQSPE